MEQSLNCWFSLLKLANERLDSTYVSVWNISAQITCLSHGKTFWLFDICAWLEEVKTLWLFLCFSISEWCLDFQYLLTCEIPPLSILKVLLHNAHIGENCPLTTEFIQLTWLSQSFLYDVLYLLIILPILADIYYFSTLFKFFFWLFYFSLK